MGDMADFTIGQIIDFHDDREPEPEGLDQDIHSYKPSIKYKVCSHCGETGLVWHNNNGQWRLAKEEFREMVIHTCDEYNKEK